MMIVSGGCSKKTETVTLEFWTLQLSPVFDNYFKTVIKKYEARHPNIKIKWVDIPYDAAIQKLMSSIAAGNPPDAVNLSADFLAKFAGINALADLKGILPKDTLNVFLPNALQACAINNKVVALPWYLNTYVYLYNKEYLEEGGFTDKQIPKTFEELVKFIKEYKKKTGKYAFFWNIGKDSYLPMMLESEGVNMTDPQMTKATFNSPEGISLISQWVDLYRGEYLQSESIVRPGSMTVEAYQSGQVASIFTGPVFINRIKTNSPSIYANTDVSLAIVGKTGKHDLAVMSLSIMATSMYKKETADFLLYLTNAENQLEFAKLSTTYPSVKEALKDSYFVALDGSAEAKARVIGAIELPYAYRLRKYFEHPQFDRLRDIFDESIQAACLGKMTTSEAVNEAAQKWNEILQAEK
jgi:putative chitobiose transport system substrate-binding protein